MRFMIIVKATRDSEAGVMPDEKLIAAMATYHEELAKAGALLDASGFQPSAKGWRIRYSGEERTLVDGPFAEAKEIIASYTLIQVKSREEAIERTKRFPNPTCAWMSSSRREGRRRAWTRRRMHRSGRSPARCPAGSLCAPRRRKATRISAISEGSPRPGSATVPALRLKFREVRT
jgi:hypothetical protein